MKNWVRKIAAGVSALALAAFVVSAFATQEAAAAKPKSIQTEAKWVSFDAEAKTGTMSFFEANPFPKMNPEEKGIFAGFRWPVIVSDKAGAKGEDNRLLHQIRNEEFVADVFKLLASAGEHGVGIIEAPAMERVFVVQLAGIDHVAKPDYESYKQDIQFQIAVNRQNSLLEQWFSPESIRVRCGFKPSS